MREIRTSGATRGEVALRVLPYSTAFASSPIAVERMVPGQAYTPRMLYPPST